MRPKHCAEKICGSCRSWTAQREFGMTQTIRALDRPSQSWNVRNPSRGRGKKSAHVRKYEASRGTARTDHHRCEIGIVACGCLSSRGEAIFWAGRRIDDLRSRECGSDVLHEEEELTANLDTQLVRGFRTQNLQEFRPNQGVPIDSFKYAIDHCDLAAVQRIGPVHFNMDHSSRTLLAITLVCFTAFSMMHPSLEVTIRHV